MQISKCKMKNWYPSVKAEKRAINTMKGREGLMGNLQ